ncbi:MAG: glycerophosphodiester phosphodiesterase [Bacteroidetes bacterium CG_4_9_14_3_um_filter_41_19]|nr:MAG: glycerophosphodiester phosphodiesterase [Bacteroidetes bacterium CG_4_9_14_3_um_filter_41_19]
MVIKNYIIAHRGESFDAPENTLASIQLAWQKEVKTVEIDVRMTIDNQIVVIHDPDTFRISGKKLVVKRSTLHELKQLDFGSHKHPKWADERIPTLREVLSTVPPEGKLIIEIKSNTHILDRLKQELSQSGLESAQIELIAFDVQILKKAKQLMPEYKMLWLLELDYSRPQQLLWTEKKKIINKVKRFHLDGVDVWAGQAMNCDFISAFKDAGLLIYAWTVNDPEKAGWLLQNGIDGITTDKAGWMTEELVKKQQFEVILLFCIFDVWKMRKLT